MTQPPDTDSDIDLPDLRQAVLDGPTLEQYFSDLDQLTEILEVSVKGAAEEYAGEGAVDLVQARMLLLAGEVRGVQIRYAWQNSEWWDTLIRRKQGIQLTRVQPPWANDSES